MQTIIFRRLICRIAIAVPANDDKINIAITPYPKDDAVIFPFSTQTEHATHSPAAIVISPNHPIAKPIGVDFDVPVGF